MRPLPFAVALLGMTFCAVALAQDRPAGNADVPKAEIVQPESQPAAPALIERAVEGMKSARSRLSEGQTGKATQDLQKQVLADLDVLLKTPPKPQSSNPSGSSGGGQQQNSAASSSNSQNRRDGESPSQQEQASGAQSQAGSQQERSQADDSEERTGQRRSGVAAPLPRRRLEVDVWGHLPDKVREQLLNGYGERMVPQYESLVRKFYESLADTAASDERPVP